MLPFKVPSSGSRPCAEGESIGEYVGVIPKVLGIQSHVIAEGAKSHVSTTVSQGSAARSTAQLTSTAVRIASMAHVDTTKSRDGVPKTYWSSPLIGILGLIANGARRRSKSSQSYVARFRHSEVRSFWRLLVMAPEAKRLEKPQLAGGASTKLSGRAPQGGATPAKQ